MRIRWGSISSLGSLDQLSSSLGKRLSHLTFRGNGNDANISGPSNPKTARKKEEGAKRKRSGVPFTKIRDIEMAKKKAARRRQLRQRERFFVFVGNIKPTIDESVLHYDFSHCGTITRIQIRCSARRAATTGQVAPDCITDFQYATIEFLDSNAVNKALKLNGSGLHGAQLVVSVTAANLPEVKDIVHTRLGAVREQKSLPNPWETKPKGSKPVTIYQTELLVGASPQVKPDRNWMMGLSFCKSLM